MATAIAVHIKDILADVNSKSFLIFIHRKIIYERTSYLGHNNLKTRSGPHRTERDLSSKRAGVINVAEVQCSTVYSNLTPLFCPF